MFGKIIYILGKGIFRHAHLVIGFLCLVYLLGGSELGAFILMLTMYFVEYVFMKIEEFEKNTILASRKKALIFTETYSGVIIILLALSPYIIVSNETRIWILSVGMLATMITRVTLKHYGVSRSVLFG